MNNKIVVDDIFGCQQLIKNVLPQSHFVDIRIRLNGQYYWFEGDFLKQILKHVEFNRIEHDIDCNLENHKEITETPATTESHP